MEIWNEVDSMKTIDGVEIHISQRTYGDQQKTVFYWAHAKMPGTQHFVQLPGDPYQDRRPTAAEIRDGIRRLKKQNEEGLKMTIDHAVRILESNHPASIAAALSVLRELQEQLRGES